MTVVSGGDQSHVGADHDQAFLRMGRWGLVVRERCALQRFDVGPAEEKLGLPEALLARLYALSAHHDTALNWADPSAPGPWSKSDYAEFCAQVEALRAEIAQALGPEFDVVNEQFDCSE